MDERLIGHPLDNLLLPSPPPPFIHKHAPPAGTNPFAYKGAHQGLGDGEETGTYEVFVSLTGEDGGLGANQLAVLQDPTMCVPWMV